MPRAALFAFAIACAPAAPDPAAARSPGTPPPPLVLSAGDLFQAHDVTLEVDGALPGDAVWFLASTRTRTGAFCPPQMGGVCLDLVQPVALGHAVADPGGHAGITVRVPRAMPEGTLITVQAAVPAGAASTKTWASTLQVYAATCPRTLADFWTETARVRACTVDAECGEVLQGTSCGCTRDWVGNLNQDTTRFYQLLADAGQCGLGLFSTCDCPTANGFACVRNTCTWNYGP